MELSTSNVFREMELFSPSLKNKKKTLFNSLYCCIYFSNVFSPYKEYI